MKHKKRIAVIGAGISGLTCAYELQKAGHDVTVYEKESWVGGRMASRTKDGFTFDIGAEHLIELYSNIHEYCDELGIEWEEMRFQKYNIFRGGKIYPMLGAIGKLSRFRLALKFFMTRGKMLDFFNLSTCTKHDTENAFDALKRSIGEENAQYLVDPFSTTYQFHSAKEISLGVALAALMSLKHHKDLWSMTRTKGGMSALPEAFAKQLTVHTNTPVTSVTNYEGKIVVTAKEEAPKTYDLVVLASTANATKNMLSQTTSEQADILEHTAYATTISLSFKVPLSVAPRVNTTFWVPSAESKTVSGYVNQLYKGEQLTSSEHTLVSTWLHEDFAKEIINKTDEEIFAIVRTELYKFCPWLASADQLTPHDLQRWTSAMPKFSKGHLTRAATFLTKGQGQNNIFLCGDYLNAPWTEGALRCGQRVAKDVIASF